MSKYDWWYRIWWRGFSGRVHKLKGKARISETFGWTAKDFGLPPAIKYHVVKAKKLRKIRTDEL